MTNPERGYLLAQLFPEELPEILRVIKSLHKVLMEDRDKIKQDWDNEMITVDFWCKVAEDTNRRVLGEGNKLLKPRRFADQLFDYPNALFTVDCIQKYAEKERKNSRFYHFVQALYKYEP